MYVGSGGRGSPGPRRRAPPAPRRHPPRAGAAQRRPGARSARRGARPGRGTAGQSGAGQRGPGPPLRQRLQRGHRLLRRAERGGGSGGPASPRPARSSGRAGPGRAGNCPSPGRLPRHSPAAVISEGTLLRGGGHRGSLSAPTLPPVRRRAQRPGAPAGARPVPARPSPHEAGGKRPRPCQQAQLGRARAGTRIATIGRAGKDLNVASEKYSIY